MANITNNRVQKTLTDAESAELDRLLRAPMDAIMPWAVSLTKMEMKKLPKMDDVNAAFVDDVIDAMRNNPEWFPSYLTADMVQQDKQLWETLRPRLEMARKVVELLDDTMMAAGIDAYGVALAVYKMVAAAAASGVPGADTVYDKLKERFEGQGGPGEVPDTVEDGTEQGNNPVA